MKPGITMNGLGLGLELLEHAGVPHRARAEALRSLAKAHRANIASISRTPTGATVQLGDFLAGLDAEARAMDGAAKQFDDMADEADKQAAETKPPEGP